MLTLESTVKSVDVFNLGAEVTRTAQLNLEGVKWPALVSLEGLPLCLQDSSLTARVSDGAKVVSSSIEVKLVGPKTGREERKEELTKRRALLSRKLEYLNWWQTALSSVGSIPQRPAGKEGEPPAPLSVHSRLEWTKFLAEQFSSHQLKTWELEDEIRELRREIEILARPENEEAIAHKAALLTLDSAESDLSGPLELEIAYRVPGVRWAPSYVLRFDAELSRVEVSLLAWVAQNTGEDWNNVSLTVTSADGEMSRELPELKSLRIGRSQPPAPGSSWKAPPLDTLALYQDLDRKLRELGGESATVFRPFELVGAAADKLEQLKEEAPARDEMAKSCAPPPPPGAAPAPLGSAVYAMSVLPPPVEKKRKDATTMLRMRSDGEGGGGDDRRGGPLIRAPRPDRLNLDNTVLDPKLRDYTRLVMPACRESGRGMLAYQSLEEQVARTARSMGLEENRFVEAVHAAKRRAHSVGYTALPQGCIHPRWPDDDGFDLSYSGESAGSVTSDGSFQSIPLQLFTLDVKPRYVSVPRETPQFFRHVSGTVDRPLPDGPADIYLDDSFLLTGPLKGAAPGGTLSLALGVEDRLKIVRNTSFKESVSGLMSKTRALEHNLEIEVKSSLHHEVSVEVRERLPHGREGDKEIDVSVTNVSPSWESFEPTEQPGFKGAKRWTFQLPAQGKKELHAGYTITVPAKYDLDNGNRRE